MTVTIERQTVEAISRNQPAPAAHWTMDFRPKPVPRPVALISAVAHLDRGLGAFTVYVSKQTELDTDDFLEGSAQVPGIYRVYAGEYGILRPVPVIEWNTTRVRLRDDLNIVTTKGTVYIPLDNSLDSPYYNYGKMYDVLDVYKAREVIDERVMLTRR